MLRLASKLEGTFRIRTTAYSRMKVKCQFEPCPSLAAARSKAMRTKCGSKLPDTFTFRISHVDVEQCVLGHWSLVERYNKSGRVI